ncbi:MAG TPA: prolyl oligopeptidase family serine peptidase [Streptosporangiaceae bacterium]|nr:prolyl oligopeptidase family serine peptidase [Streptosporangiaceae bacterium]
MTPSRYPDAPRLDTADTIHGHVVADPYRWLEDADGAQTTAWLAAQDALCAGYLAGLPGRDWVAARVAELLATGAVSPPAWRGERCFFTQRAPGQEHAVLYVSADATPGRALVDPTGIDPSGQTTLDAWHAGPGGRLLAYQLSKDGSEESVLWVMDVASGEVVDGPIDRTRFTPVAWTGDGKAFYYVRRLPPRAVSAGEEQYHRRVYLHRVGSPAAEDVLVFGDGQDKTTLYTVWSSIDGRWLVLGASQGTAPRNDLWVADLAASAEAAPEFRVAVAGRDARTSGQVGRDGRLYLLTNLDAPRGRLAVADPARPGPAGWTDLLGQDGTAVLTGYTLLDGSRLDRPVLLASWARHGISEVSVHEVSTGQRVADVRLPGLGTVSGLTARPEGGHEGWFAYTDDVTPVTVYSYDALTDRTAVWARPPGSAGLSGVATQLVTYTSADGTEVHMRVVSGTGGQPGTGGPAGTPPRPAILHGYGGFNIASTPEFSADALAWVEAGGVYAVAGLRGGSEDGEDWHRAGMREHKQNVFDDMHAAAERLIADGWTTPSQLCVAGGSNGGLLVGAVLTQRPDLYAAVVCSAPLLDMVRYERFGLGRLWTDEYGTAEDPTEFGWLLSYSPYHHVREGTAYPAVLFTAFDGDTRVDPLHARKMCAALQHATGSPPAQRPVLLRYERDVGHGARAVSRSVALAADTKAFAAALTGLRLPSAQAREAAT